MRFRVEISTTSRGTFTGKLYLDENGIDGQELLCTVGAFGGQVDQTEFHDREGLLARARRDAEAFKARKGVTGPEIVSLEV